MSYIEDYDETIDSLASEAWWENKRSKTDLDSLVRSAADRYTATFGDAEAVMRFTSNATALWDEGIGLSDEAASSYRGVIRAIAYHALMRDVYDTISVNEPDWEDKWHDENHAGLTFDEYYDIIVGYGIPNSNNETPESVIETLRGDGYVKSEEDYNNAYEAARDLKDDGAY
tara:strand:- start:2 stop:517 length:516 start_codon:yes stop_codon:yes gene_type:complete